MKKITLILCVLLLVTWSQPLAAQENPLSDKIAPPSQEALSEERPVVFELSPEGAPSITHRGLSDGKNFWVPINLLREYGLLLSEDLKTETILIRVPSPEKRLAARGLSFYAGDNLDLLFKARRIGNVLFLNLRGLGKITGIITPENATGESLLLSPLSGDIDQAKTVAPLPEIKGKINLVWDHVTKAHKDLSSADSTVGLDVLSPTWFALQDNKGGVTNLAHAAYVENAHRMGYRVWALVSNSFDRKKTREFLVDAQAQKLFIARLLAYTALYNLDGINIDFENVDTQDRARLSHFVSQLSHALHGQGVTVSIDVTFPFAWANCYDLPGFARAVDYVMVMAYDEHWRTSPKAGSTASLPWVEAGIQRTLQQVPAQKLLLGVPFYTREWEETAQAGKKPLLKSRALSMASAEQRLLENSVPPLWLEDKGQHYVKYSKNGKRYQIWLEDDHSMQRRADLILKYDLAGAAGWRKGFEKSSIWDVLNKKLKGDAP